jgi:dinuclear metal center YbgI/SA1388 family protein
MNLPDALLGLRAIAPEGLAGDWDNVGLLLEGDRPVRSALVTIDLTPAVYDEVEAHDVDLVIAYHPTIFRGLKRLTRRSAHGPALLGLARAGRHLYSPHTALDAVPGGINDWLLEGFEGVAAKRPVEPALSDPEAGTGRVATIEPIDGRTALQRVKAHLDLDHVRVAGELERTIRSVAVCPGAGTSVFRALDRVDLLLTGEMSHHDVLAWVARGTTVFLTEHTNTERGFLPRYAAMIREKLGIDVRVSTADHDPLTVH